MTFNRAILALELFHLPDKPAGVVGKQQFPFLAFKLLHLPDKPAGVVGKLFFDRP